jgi:formylglycine-generating enzyme required for sulfatase activity
MFRGGNWKFLPGAVRASVRSWEVPTLQNNGLGFRCAGDLG